MPEQVHPESDCSLWMTHISAAETSDKEQSGGSFYRCINQKRKIKESLTPLMNKNGDLVSIHEEKAEVLKNIFTSVFTSSLSPHSYPVDGL